MVLSIIGTVAGVISAYFGYVAVRNELTRRRTRSEQPAEQPAQQPTPRGDGTYDVFVSYGPEDAEWVRTFAGRLGEKGLRVAYDEVVSRPGGIRVHTVEAAIRAATHGLLVFSPASVGNGWVDQEYAALMQRSIEDGVRFIPVVVGDVRLPEFAATRYFVDFRPAHDCAGYERRVDEIAEALRSLGE